MLDMIEGGYAVETSARSSLASSLSSRPAGRGPFGRRTSTSPESPPPAASRTSASGYEDGELLGYLFTYGPDQPASVVALLVRGDRSIYERTATSFEPASRSGAVLLADLEASTSLSRWLTSAAYFRLSRSVRSSLETAVAEHGGILRKHAGDGAYQTLWRTSRGRARRGAGGRHGRRSRPSGLEEAAAPVDSDARGLQR